MIAAYFSAYTSLLMISPSAVECSKKQERTAPLHSTSNFQRLKACRSELVMALSPTFIISSLTVRDNSELYRVSFAGRFATRHNEASRLKNDPTLLFQFHQHAYLPGVYRSRRSRDLVLVRSSVLDATSRRASCHRR